MNNRPDQRKAYALLALIVIVIPLLIALLPGESGSGSYDSFRATRSGN